MILKILGILDIFSAVLIFLFNFLNFFPSQIIILIGVYLLVKGVLFSISKDPASMLDIAAAIIVLATLNFTVPFLLLSLVSIYLIQKGIFSLL